jgi:hypothetical protein
MNFRLWLENDETALRRAWNHIVDENRGIYRNFGNIEWHKQMVRLLRIVGMGKEANALELAMPPEDVVAFGKQPMSGGLTLGDVLQHKKNKKKREEHSLFYNNYMAIIEDIADQLGEALGED